MLLVDWYEQIRRCVRRLGLAEEQVTIRTQSEMKGLKDPLLHLTVEINQQVTAAYQVEP